MNINLAIVNRALNKAGEEELTETEIKENQNRWKLIKNYYLSTILETLSNTSWTSQTVRQNLKRYVEEKESIPVIEGEYYFRCTISNYWNGQLYKKGKIYNFTSIEDIPDYFEEVSPDAFTKEKQTVNNMDGFYIYELPEDCAKPIELVNNADYTVENNKLYTTDPNAVLVYVSNNFTGKDKYEAVLGVRESDIIADVYTPVQVSSATFVANTYYVKNENETYSLASIYDPKETYYSKENKLVNNSFYVKDGNDFILATEYAPDATYYKVVEEDYPGFNDFNFDPLLSEYIETKLAAKIVLKISGKENLYQLLYSEAVRMENTAVKATFAHAHNKDKGNKYWGETLGLPTYGEDY